MLSNRSELKELLWPSSSRVKPRLNVLPYRSEWRKINMVASVLFFLYGSLQFADPDWWLWVPWFYITAFLSLTVAYSPKIVERFLWRYLCAYTIVLGMMYLMYLLWVVRDVTSAYIQDPSMLREGRAMPGVSVAVMWSLMLRLTASSRGGMINIMRLGTLCTTVGCCAVVFFWSLCFYRPAMATLPYCWSQFAEGYKNI